MPWLRDTAAVVGNHHEKVNGSGYQRGLKAEEIPLTARIFALADVFDAVTSRRPYHEPLGFDEAMAVLERGRGTHFEAGLPDAFARIARPLFDEFADRDDETPRREVARLVQRYFTHDLEALLRLRRGAGVAARRTSTSATSTTRRLRRRTAAASDSSAMR